MSDMYGLASKLPNFIVKTVSAKDVEYWIKHQSPGTEDKDLFLASVGLVR